MRICFLILHYRTMDETIACVAQIKALHSADIAVEVLIVDNCSADGSYEMLCSEYSQDAQVRVVSAPENKGFSAGNNFGYAALENRETLDFLVLCNSDLEFPQADFLQRLTQRYCKERFDILYPDVYCAAFEGFVYHGHQSPFLRWEFSPFYVYASICCYKAKLDHIKKQPVPFLTQLQTSILHLLQRVLRTVKGLLFFSWSKHPHKNSGGVGACIVLSREFLHKYDKPLEPEPFFYYEEHFLWLRVQRDGLMSVYEPMLKVNHLQGASVANSNSDETQKKLFHFTQLYTSGKMYLAFCKKNGGGASF